MPKLREASHYGGRLARKERKFCLIRVLNMVCRFIGSHEMLIFKPFYMERSVLLKF